MKKPLITAIAALALSTGAQAETKFYGKMNVSTGFDDASEDFSVNSHASRLGVKGSDDLGFATVIYQAEYGNNIDAGGTLGARNTYLGLDYDGLGTVKLGRMDTPMKTSQGKFDLFNDVFDISDGLLAENRANNQLNYTSEKMGNLQVSGSAIFEQANSDGYSFSAEFEKDALYAAVAYNKDVQDGDLGAALDTVRATFVYNQNNLRLGAMVNHVEVGAFDDTGFAFNLAVTQGLHVFKAQFISSDQRTDGVLDTGYQAVMAGVDRKLAKTTKAYVYARSSESDNVSSAAEAVVGLEHKF